MGLQLYGYSTLEAGFLTGINYYALKDGDFALRPSQSYKLKLPTEYSEEPTDVL